MNKNVFTINDTSIITRNANQTFSEIDEEIVMLSIEKGEYYYLDAIGSKIWRYIESPQSYKDLIGWLIKEFEVSFETCDTETKDYLKELYNKGLVEISTS